MYCMYNTYRTYCWDQKVDLGSGPKHIYIDVRSTAADPWKKYKVVGCHGSYWLAVFHRYTYIISYLYIYIYIHISISDLHFAIRGDYFWDLRSVFGHPWATFRGPSGLSPFIFRGVTLGAYFWDPRAAFGHTRPPFLWPGGRILRPMSSLFKQLVPFWSSGPGLRSQWDTLAHFLEKGVKKVINERPAGVPNGTFCNTFSVFLLFCGCCCGSLAETGFWVFVL